MSSILSAKKAECLTSTRSFGICFMIDDNDKKIISAMRSGDWVKCESWKMHSCGTTQAEITSAPQHENTSFCLPGHHSSNHSQLLLKSFVRLVLRYV